jgi:hypothetical protein
MATISITSPGVQINETDLSLLARPIGSTDVLITGFAPQGPTEELVNVGSVSEFESVFGTPTNGAERYLYHTAKQILSQSPANLIVNRLPYGSNLGEGYSNSYSALVYQISCNDLTYAESTRFEILPPKSILLTEDEYYKLTTNQIDWADSPYQYAVGDDTFMFGSLLTNATSAITQGQKVYGISTAQLDSFTEEELESVGITGFESISAAYGYLLGEFENFNNWDNPTSPSSIGFTNIYNKASAQSGAQTAVVIWDHIFSPNTTSETYDSVYGDSNTVYYAVTAYNFDGPGQVYNIESFADIEAGYGGFIVVNSSKTAINNYFEGYYVGIADNSNFNPATDYNALGSLRAVIPSTGATQQFLTVPSSRLNFALTQSASAFSKDSLSKVIEQYPIGYDFSTKSFEDSVVFVMFKVKSTQYNQDTLQLDFSVQEGYAGSFNANRTQNNPNGGQPVSFFLDTVINTSSLNIKAYSNPYFSTQGTWTKDDGNPNKRVRVNNDAKAAFASGVYTVQNTLDNKDLGDVAKKLERFLDIMANDETTNIDVIADAGLSTIWATAKSRSISQNTDLYIFDENYTPEDIDSVSGIGNTNVNVVPQGVTLDAYRSITNNFVKYAEARRDHVFISDPLRQVFVRGQNGKVSAKKNFVFSNDIYWPLNNLYAPVQSSYVATYGNWIKANDVYSGKSVWLPPSGYITAIVARSAQTTYPWIAPAGFTRGTLTNVLDIAVNPTQKQRDLLYKINVNPIAFFNQDGFVVFGQKTTYRKPSAFDRINVRRLFLVLEKTTQRLLKYYVFEPNSFATRNRLKGALTPIFDQAKLNDGCYDYLIVCDTTNNTPDIIDNNQLKVSIYIQPVRAAEFILADFIATRTGVNFSELIAGGQS